MHSIHIYLIYRKGASEDPISAHSTSWGAHEWLAKSPETPQTAILVRLLDGLSGAESGYKGSTPLPWRQEIFDLIGKNDLGSACKRASIQQEDWPQWAKGVNHATQGENPSRCNSQ
jgi:hypothetical protein